jgi:hypothetical protein
MSMNIMYLFLNNFWKWCQTRFSIRFYFFAKLASWLSQNYEYGLNAFCPDCHLRTVVLKIWYLRISKISILFGHHKLLMHLLDDDQLQTDKELTGVVTWNLYSLSFKELSKNRAYLRFSENFIQFKLLCKKLYQSVDVWGCLSSSIFTLNKWIVLTKIINYWKSSSCQMINVGLAIFILTDLNFL